MEEEITDPVCEGHNWEIGQVRPEWNGANSASPLYQEIALVICSFCGIVKKTRITNL